MTSTADPIQNGAGATAKLAEFAVTLPFESIPIEVVDRLKQCILDEMGVIIGATGLAEEAEPVYQYVKGLGGKPEASFLGYGGRAPAMWAAFLNGALAHMLDYEDTVQGPIHTSTTTIPSALAMSERLGQISGRELLTAVAVGFDLMARIGRSANLTEDWFGTQFLGYLAGAAAAGRLLHLNQEQMENALGIAFNQLSGTREMASGEATHLRGMQGGFLSQGAVVAASLAQKGITGPRDVLEGRYGLYKTYVPVENPDWGMLTNNLGEDFWIMQSHHFKVWPACAGTRSTVAGVLQLREEHGIDAEDIENVHVTVAGHQNMLLWEPLDSKRQPPSSIDAKYSIPFTAAIAAQTGNVTLNDYTDEGLVNPAVLAMAQRVTYETADESGKARNTVAIRTRSGQTFSKLVTTIPGNPDAPVSQQRIEDKFRDCVRFSATPIPPEDVERAIELVRDLENVRDVSEIIRLLSPSRA